MKRSRPRSLTKEEDPWEFLRERAENLLLSNRRAAKPPLTSSSTDLENGTWFPIPCHQADTVQESTSTLLAARGYAKAGYSTLAWQAIESLLSVQTTNGFLPKYRYDTDINSTDYYIHHTDIPSWKLFENFTSMYSSPRQDSHSTSSGRITTLPFHASFLLDVFFLSNQTKMDILHLNRNFHVLYQQHDVIHSVVMRGCHVNITTVPCYNVIHPWQTLIPDTPDSSFWKTALSQIKQRMHDWKPPVSSEYHDDASVYLLQCLQNATKSCHSTISCEDAILASCPFAMLDVGFAAALDQSNHDLSTMATMLHELRALPGNELEPKLKTIQSWKAQSNYVLETLLWNEQYQTYLSRHVVFHKDENNSRTAFVPEQTTSWYTPPHATVYNFMSLWTILNEARRNRMTFHMMQHSGPFAFDCGDYPLWSVGGCHQSTNDATITISPMINYLISKGLVRNRVDDTSQYLANSTLNLQCGLPNTLVHDNHTLPLCQHVVFWNEFHADTGLPVTLHPVCGETAVAAAISNILVEDGPFSYTPAPPIGSRWVLTIVLCELFVAFWIGVSCCLLNLHLFRRLNHSANAATGEGESRNGLFRSYSDGADMQYFSAAASLEEADENENEDDYDAGNGVSS